VTRETVVPESQTPLTSQRALERLIAGRGTLSQETPSPRWILLADDDELVRGLWKEMLTQGRVIAPLKPARGGRHSI
jgi:hypothetical protein